MDQLWIIASVLAAFFQSLRHAALKEMNRHLSASVTSYARVLFGLPLLIAWLAGVMWATGDPLPAPTPAFLAFSALAALTQFLGTAALIHLFRLGNMAVGIMLNKTDVILTAIVGSLLFSERITPGGWLAIVITVAGVMIASAGRLPLAGIGGRGVSILRVVLGRPTQIGLLSGLIFATSYLALREGILALGPTGSPMVRSAFAAVAMTAISFVIMGIWLLATQPTGLAAIRRHMGLGLVVGATSAVGTVAWFLASALANASYVAAVAQVQIVFTLALSRYWFHESITRIELAGIVVILAGVLMFRLV